MWARDASEVADAVVELCSTSLGRRAAAWSAADPAGRPSLRVSPGAGERRLLRVAPPPRSSAASVRDRLERILGVGPAGIVDAGAVVLAVEGPLDPAEGASLRALIEGALANARSAALAEARNRNLDTALACALHELSAPVLAAQAAIESHLESDGRAPLLVGARDQLEGAARLCEDVLRWAAGRSPQLRSVDLGVLVREAIASIEPSLGASRTRVAVTPGIDVRADRSLLLAALRNLIRNALLYSGEGGHVGIRVTSDGREARVAVTDDGPGVPADAVSIFDPFVRGASGRSPRDGNGLGLFVARRAVEAHGGRLWAEPTKSGAAFVAALPLSEEVPTPSAS
jgi:two-component system sensor histidine kinase KdpD